MEDKVKCSVWLREDTTDLIKTIYKSDHCRTRSEFIEKAILYYINYLTMERNMDILSPVLISSLRALVEEQTSRIMSMLFKLATEEALMSNVLAFKLNVSKEDIDLVRGECIKDLKRNNNIFDFKKAVDWQKGVESDG